MQDIEHEDFHQQIACGHAESIRIAITEGPSTGGVEPPTTAVGALILHHPSGLNLIYKMDAVGARQIAACFMDIADQIDKENAQ